MNRKTWFGFSVVVITAILESSFALVSPRIVGVIIDRVFYGKEIDLMLPLLGLLLGAGFGTAFFRFVQRYINEYVSQSIIYDLRNRLYSKIQKQSIDFFDRMETGQLISRGTSDVRSIRRLLSVGFRIFLRAIILYAGIFILIGLMNWKMMLIVLGIAPILFLIMFFYAKNVRPLYREIQNKFGDLNSILAENVHGSRVVRAFAAEDIEIDKFEVENQNYLDINMQVAKLRSYIVTLFPFILSIGTFLLLYIGGREVISGGGALGVGSLIAINSYLILLQRPTRFMAFSILHFQEGTASLNRIFEIIDMEKKIVEKPDAIALPRIKGKISFKGVTFSYIEDNPPVLRNISLEIQPGETVAFLGTTGSGKSTIVSLVPRFYDPDEGAVLIDGINIKDVKIESIRKQIALVQQEAFLFAKTIRENISFGRPDAPDEEIIRAAKIAQAHEFITSFPDGYDTEVGERGVTLSGGQKQRLTIARALLIHSPILIMDDSSSALDFETEHQFQKAVNELVKGRTTLIVTQRLSTIKFATKIVVMDQGEIVEMGTHNDLMANNGLYKHLYETQLIGREISFDDQEQLKSIGEIKQPAPSQAGGQK